ncbi:MAG: 1-acyl-sn-glycerol-3-phosphate acyltransferase, partial [Chitinophagales bacterium]
ASGKTLDQALANMEKINPRIDSLKSGSLVKKSSGVSALLFSNALQQERIQKWKAYWSSGKKQKLLGFLVSEGKDLHFKPDAFESFASFIDRDFQPLNPETVKELENGALADYITENPEGATVSTVLRVSPGNKKTVYKEFENLPDITVLDKQYLAEKFVEIVNADFTRIALMTSILVFSVLLLTYGRIELTMVSFIPMAIAWIWILGIMGLAGIRFNIINIILSALIFGLGDDYSLFIMDGLLQEYKTGKKNLSSFKSSIILSAITTLAGLGVLIFAKHPALQSIAVVSIIGMLSVVLIAQTLIPFLFGLLITNRVKYNRFPWTFLSYSLSIFSYVYFALGALLLTVVGFFLIRLNPFQKEKGKLVYHRMLSAYAWSVMYIMGNVKKRVLNPLKEDFAKPCVIIANHSSFLDILLTAMLYPKLILLTNNWVWNSPVFGQVVKLADYYPVQQGIENSIDLLADRINNGYSIVIFPEGSRSPNDQIRRFHKGAFFLAEKLELDILPIMIHGSGYGITKGDFLLKDAWICLKFLPRILPGDDRFGEGYVSRAKLVGRYFRAEFEEFKISEEQPKFFKEQLMYNYIYKGPVLEWYLKVKLRLEKNYQAFHEMLPRNCEILDLGCGYGFMDYMLQFAAPGRRITGIDYDEVKINLARHCFSRNDHIEFICADISKYSFGCFDAIILSDTLHYLPKEKQRQLIAKCIDHLNEDGMIIIREGNQDLEKKHRGTRLTEFFSTKVLGFNKTGPGGLTFLSGSMLKEMAAEKNLSYKVVDHSLYTSNMIFVLSRAQQLVQ